MATTIPIYLGFTIKPNLPEDKKNRLLITIQTWHHIKLNSLSSHIPFRILMILMEIYVKKKSYSD